MRRSALILVLVLVVLGVMAAPAIAQPPPDPHDHFLVVPGTDEEVQIGPKRCTGGESLQGAFLKFHFNVHVGKPFSVAGLTINPDSC